MNFRNNLSFHPQTHFFLAGSLKHRKIAFAMVENRIVKKEANWPTNQLSNLFATSICIKFSKCMFALVHLQILYKIKDFKFHFIYYLSNLNSIFLEKNLPLHKLNEWQLRSQTSLSFRRMPYT